MIGTHALVRTVTAGVGFAALVAAVATIPRSAGGAASAIARARIVPASPPSREPLSTLPKRNPFAGDPAEVASSIGTATVTHAIASPAGTIPQVHAIPPAAGATEPGDSRRVTAIVTGSHPFAIVEDTRGSHLVTIGDALNGGVVVAIDADGIRFSHGPELLLAAPKHASAVRLP